MAANNEDKTEVDFDETIEKLEQNLQEWMELRKETIETLRSIATYIESFHRKSTIAKAVSSGSGIVGGGLTLVGGALTIATGGIAAIPVLIGKCVIKIQCLKCKKSLKNIRISNRNGKMYRCIYIYLI